jgi:mxaC protein
MSFAHPWLLLFLPLAFVPLYRSAQPTIRYSSLALIPKDRVSNCVGAIVRCFGALAIAAIVVGLAQPYQRGAAVERLGRGAEIILLLDRSRSMDQAFHSVRDNRTWTDTNFETKAHAAARLLSEFARERTQDLFAMMVFSTLPMPVLDFTQKQEVIQAAIAAGDEGKGLSDTEIGGALEAALELFGARPYQGSRVILLVSDGGAHIDFETRRRIVREMKRQKVSLYWIYLRSFRSPGLNPPVAPEAAEAIPEYFLHKFFVSMSTPYQAFEAENPQALEHAIAEVSRLENLPIRFTEVVAQRDLSQWCFGAALVASLLLAASLALTLKAWG